MSIYVWFIAMFDFLLRPNSEFLQYLLLVSYIFGRDNLYPGHKLRDFLRIVKDFGGATTEIYMRKMTVTGIPWRFISHIFRVNLI